MFKNVAGQKLVVFAFNATTNLPVNGDAANITAYANLDDAGINVLADTSATEIDATNAKGYYLFDLAQAETNANKGHYTAKSSTANVVVIAVPAVVYTLPANLTAMAIDSSGIVKSYDNLGNTLATAASVANIAVTGAALNATSGSRTITTGTGTGGVANTTGVDGVYDNIADSAGTIDFYYQFDLSATAGAAAVGVQWTGYVVGVVNTLKVYAYNWGGSSWDQIGTIVGIAGTVNSVEEWELTNAHTGTGGNLGLVRIRFNATGLTSATVKTDRILGGYVVTLAGATVSANLIQVDGLATATGAAVFNLKQLNIINSTGSAIVAHSTGSNGSGFDLLGNGTGHGINALGGSSSGDGFRTVGGPNNGNGITAVADTGLTFAVSAASGISVMGKSTSSGAGLKGWGIDGGPCISLQTGGTATNALSIVSTTGNGIDIQTSSGHGVNIQAGGTSKHGLFVTGGTGGTSDGAKFVAGTGGVDVRGNITGNIIGTLTTVTNATNVTNGVNLASTGLDSIAITDPGNASSLTTFPKLLVALCRRMFWKKSDLNATKLNMYADNGTTVNMHMPVSDDGTTQTQGAAVDGP
jgi:hypothetical protein